MPMPDIRRGAPLLEPFWVWPCVALLGVSVLAGAEEPTPTIVAPNVRPILSQLIVDQGPLRRLRQFLDAGNDPLAHDRDGDTAVHYAAAAEDPAYLEFLLARGQSPDTRNLISGRTPLITAILYGRDAQIRMLLAAGASVAMPDAIGNTPLHVAAQINAPKYVLMLLDAGAPAAARNAQGQTFQRYLFMAPSHLLSDETSRARRAVTAWLQTHGVALEAGAR